MVRCSILLLLAGCNVHVKTPAPPDPIVVEAQNFVEAVSSKMPEWDADVMLARYEQAEIAQVKTDIAQANSDFAQNHLHFFEDVARLHEDWNKLVALDLILQRSYVL